jgi:glucokinase
MKVVEKFSEIFGVEVGNTALKVLPYGGIYLIGGVTAGISDYLMHSDTFINAMYSKGRQEKKVRKMPVFIVKPDI